MSWIVNCFGSIFFAFFYFYEELFHWFGETKEKNKINIKIQNKYKDLKDCRFHIPYSRLCGDSQPTSPPAPLLKERGDCK